MVSRHHILGFRPGLLVRLELLQNGASILFAASSDPLGDYPEETRSGKGFHYNRGQMAPSKLIAIRSSNLKYSMSSQPVVSVCIPCYNGAEFLARTLESVLAQIFTNFEVVLLDDKSTDATLSVIGTFTDPRIRLIRNEQNLGLALSWKKVLSQSKGTYVKLLCNDDVLLPECLAKQVNALENPSNARAVLAFCNRRVIDSNDEVVLERRLPFPPGLVKGSTLIRQSVRRGTNLIGEPAVGLFRRDALNKTVMWDASNAYYSDLALWAQLLRHGDAFHDPEYLAGFRISRGAASTRIGFGQAAPFRSLARTLRKDPCYRISSFDVIAGYVLSFHWCLARNLFINFHCRRAARKQITALPLPGRPRSQHIDGGPEVSERQLWPAARQTHGNEDFVAHR